MYRTLTNFQRIIIETFRSYIFCSIYKSKCNNGKNKNKFRDVPYKTKNAIYNHCLLNINRFILNNANFNFCIIDN